MLIAVAGWIEVAYIVVVGGLCLVVIVWSAVTREPQGRTRFDPPDGHRGWFGDRE